MIERRALEIFQCENTNPNITIAFEMREAEFGQPNRPLRVGELREALIERAERELKSGGVLQ